MSQLDRALALAALAEKLEAPKSWSFIASCMTKT